MDKKELQKQYEKLSDQITKMLDEAEKLKEKIDSIPDKKEGRYKPEYGTRYFYLDSWGRIQDASWVDSNVDNFRFNTGNCFKTKEEARDYRDNLLTKQQLKDIALELNEGAEIEWDTDSEQIKYYIEFSHFSGKLELSWVLRMQHNCVYCLSSTFLEVAKLRIGEEKLIKLIKSGV